MTGESLTYTEHHEALPIVHDPIVLDAIQLLKEAQWALEKGNQYNGKGIHVQDYWPEGIPDGLRCIMEPFVRLNVSGKRDQARDTAGYVALFCAWIIAGCPQSKFAEVMRAYATDIYGNLLKQVKVDNA